MQEQHKNGTRIKLSVSLEAPEIVVPLRSDSKEVILADLGRLTLSNSFYHPPSESTALAENYDIQLADLQVIRYINGMLLQWNWTPLSSARLVNSVDRQSKTLSIRLPDFTARKPLPYSSFYWRHFSKLKTAIQVVWWEVPFKQGLRFYCVVM